LKAAELIALATAHHIDLTNVGGTASRLDGIAAPRRLTAAERKARRQSHLGLDVLPTATGDGSRVHRRPAWSVAEVGQAACGVPRMPWLATMYSIAGDSSGYPELHRGLMLEALDLAAQQNWPMKITKRGGHRDYYQAQLAALVLDADRHRPYFATAPTLYALCMDVDTDIWERYVCDWYVDLQLEYERWLGIARGIVRGWIMEDEEAPRAA